MTALQRALLSTGAEDLVARLHAGAGPEAGIDCDLLIVGSGYGGAVAAARTAGATVADAAVPGGRRPAVVWLMERGREHRAGDFPSRFADLPGEVRFGRQDGRSARGVAEGLFDVRLGDDVQVLLGNGLGGGSLINAGVMEALAEGMFDAGWPAALAQDAVGRTAASVRAAAMLSAAPLPDPPPPKLLALRAMATATGLGSNNGLKCHIGVATVAGTSQAGVEMRACTRCGDCVTGCNQGAKHTLDTNYLAWARRAGAELFCGGAVDHIVRDPAGHWQVHWQYTDPRQRTPDAPVPVLRARQVVLAAGSLGSTEILLRSRAHGLALSGRLGQHFSTNGSTIAAAFRQAVPVHASRDEDADPGTPCDVGPTITGLVRTQGDGINFVVEEFAVPAPLRRVMGEVTTTFGLFHAMFAGPPTPHPADAPGDEDERAVTTSSLEHTSILGFVGDDGAQGRITLPDGAAEGGVRLHWNRDDPTLPALIDAQLGWLGRACQPPGNNGSGGTGGIAVPNPTWRMLPSELAQLIGMAPGSTVTVHPLGGCGMGDDAAVGVVDDAGRVFDGAGGTHEGLAVLDGAIVPRALGINPALTIAALAERALPLLAGDWGFELGDPAMPPAGALPAARDVAPRRPAARVATALRIGEQLHGTLTVGGRAVWAELEVPAIAITNLAATLTHRQRELPFGTGDFAPRLRMYRQRPGSDDEPERNWVGAAKLAGTMTLLEPGRLQGSACLMAQIDAVRMLLDRARSRPDGLGPIDGDDEDASSFFNAELLEALLNLLQAVTHTRTLRYAFTVQDGGRTGLPAGSRLTGTKTLEFAELGNPWRQLSTMAMTLTPPEAGATTRALGELCVDLDYFARWRLALLELTRQRDQPNALGDLAAFALLLARMLMQSHWPHFLPPGDMPPRIAERRPGPLPGLCVEGPTTINEHGAFLTRFRQHDHALQGHPLLMIHGLSAAGSTFAHPSIPHNLVRFMAGRHRRDVWVLDLRTSAAIEPAPGQPRPGPHTFEGAGDDIAQAVDHIRAATGAPPVDVIAHCIGSVMFSLAVLDSDTLHHKIGRVVLSQVGPTARLSPYNRLRGVIASFLQQYLEVDELDTRPDFEQVAQGQWQPRRPRSAVLTLLDALLASFPYPEDDDEAARARRIDWLPDVSRDFRLVRHRADALVGHSMRLANVGDATLLALDAIYGWVKTATLAQTLHLAREGVPTDADGANRVVSGENLGRRFDFPVLLLHGRHNAIFDVDGSVSCHATLARAFRDPDTGVQDLAGDKHHGVGTRRQLIELHRYGHQDTLIGAQSHAEVFPYIARFLSEPLPQAAPLPADNLRFRCREPWMGPVLGWVREAPGQTLDLSVLVHAGPRDADTLGVVLIPARLDAAGIHWTVHADQARIHDLPRPADQTWRAALQAQALTLALPRPPAGETVGCAVLLLRRSLDDPATSPDHLKHPPKYGQPMPPGPQALSRKAQDAVCNFLTSRSTIQLDDLVLRVPPAVVAACDHMTAGAGVQPLAFVLGSCQYPFGLFDKRLAGLSWTRVHQEIGRASGLADAPIDGADGDAQVHANLELGAEQDADAYVRGNVQATWADEDEAARLPPPGFALLLGDQVYLDAASNVFEVPGVDAAHTARRAYELNWRLRAWRRVAAGLPMIMMLDDHEIGDDWAPPPGGLDDAEIAALCAYRQHQAKLAPPPLGDLDTEGYSFAFAPGGVPFFVLDTRTQRQRRSVAGGGGTQPVASATIVPDAVMARLEAWLITNRDAPVKFIASPSPVLPLDRHDGSDAERLGLDGWSGYPASLHRLLRFIDDAQIAGVVLLGGDAHLSVVARLTFASRLVVHSVVSSGLYAPWPFANARAESLLLDGPLQLSHGGYVVSGQMECLAWMASAGYALLAVDTGPDELPRVRVQLKPHDGSAGPGCEFRL